MRSSHHKTQMGNSKRRNAVQNVICNIFIASRNTSDSIGKKAARIINRRGNFFFANAAATKTTKNVYFFFVKIISENLWSIDAYAYFIAAHYDICFVRDRTRVHATRTRTIWCRLSSTHAEQRLLWLTFDERGMEIPQLVLLVGRVLG